MAYELVLFTSKNESTRQVSDDMDALWDQVDPKTHAAAAIVDAGSQKIVQKFDTEVLRLPEVFSTLD